MMTTEKKSNLRMKRAEQRRKEKEFLEILLQLSEDLPWQHKWWNLVSPEFREKDWIQAMYQELVHGRVPGLQTLRQCLGDPISPTIIVRMNLIGLILEVTNLERQYCAKVCKINITQLRRLQELVEMCDEVIARMPKIAQNPQVQELMKELKNWLAVEKQHYQDSTLSQEKLIKQRKVLFRKAFLGSLPREILGAYEMDAEPTLRAELVNRAVQLKCELGVSILPESQCIRNVSKAVTKDLVDSLTRMQETDELQQRLLILLEAS